MLQKIKLSPIFRWAIIIIALGGIAGYIYMFLFFGMYNSFMNIQTHRNSFEYADKYLESLSEERNKISGVVLDKAVVTKYEDVTYNYIYFADRKIVIPDDGDWAQINKGDDLDIVYNGFGKAVEYTNRTQNIKNNYD